MALEIISKKPNGETINKIIEDGKKNNSHAGSFILECTGEKEAGIVSIKVPNHRITIDLNDRSISIKDLGTEIRAK